MNKVDNDLWCVWGREIKTHAGAETQTKKSFWITGLRQLSSIVFVSIFKNVYVLFWLPWKGLPSYYLNIIWNPVMRREKLN